MHKRKGELVLNQCQKSPVSHDVYMRHEREKRKKWFPGKRCFNDCEPIRERKTYGNTDTWTEKDSERNEVEMKVGAE